MRHKELTDYLVRSGVLKTPWIVNAFQQIDRADFVHERLRDIAYEDTPLPIGWGATISQPYVVAFMLELLEPQPGQKILDIGSGSGWTTTLIAHIVGRKADGKVVALERIPELKVFGEKNCAKYNFVEKGIAMFVAADGTKGLPEEAPFDAIQAAAALRRTQSRPVSLTRGTEPVEAQAISVIPPAWREQLKVGGRIVAPIGDSIWRFSKKEDGTFTEEEYPGFIFVPLVKE